MTHKRVMTTSQFCKRGTFEGGVDFTRQMLPTKRKVQMNSRKKAPFRDFLVWSRGGWPSKLVFTDRKAPEN